MQRERVHTGFPHVLSYASFTAKSLLTMLRGAPATYRVTTAISSGSQEEGREDNEYDWWKKSLTVGARHVTVA